MSSEKTNPFSSDKLLIYATLGGAMKCLVVLSIALASAGCVTAPTQWCPGYGPAHKLTDDLIESLNTSVRLWPAGTTPETDALKAAGWQFSVWDDRRFVICTSDRATMRAFLSHRRADDSKIVTEEQWFRFSRTESGWIVAGRSKGTL